MAGHHLDSFDAQKYINEGKTVAPFTYLVEDTLRPTMPAGVWYLVLCVQILT